MRRFVARAGPTNFGTLRDLLLVVIGCNVLLFLALVQPSRMAGTLIGAVGVVLLLIGVYGTAREMMARG